MSARIFLAAALASFSCAAADLGEAREAAKQFTVPDGFTVEAVAAEPLLQNPVAFSIDEAGRFWIAETHRLDHSVFDITKETNWLRADLAMKTVAERAAFMRQTFATNEAVLTQKSERLAVVADLNGDGELGRAEVGGPFNRVESGLAAGVLARGGKVFFASIPDLWSFDVANVASNALAMAKGKILSTGYGVHIGVTGHDLHGLAVGMDGKLCFSVGDRAFNLGPGLEHPETGGVLRCDLDGSNLEVVAIGLRNPQELAFDDLGNLWTADNDTAGEDKCRLIHVVEGADYGWRFSYQHMKGFGPWVQERLWEGTLDGTLPTAGEPAQGPSGLAFYPGTGLPESYDGAFFLCDFPGGIQTFKLRARGASFEMIEKKRFLWNAWPTDVEFGPDGFLYFTDWVAGWTTPAKGRIYKVRHKGAEPAPLPSNFSQRSSDELVRLLGHRDLRVRHGAHVELADRREISALKAVARDTSASRYPRLHAIWALWIAGLKNWIEPVLRDDADEEIRAAFAPVADETALWVLLADKSPRVRLSAGLQASRRDIAAGKEILALLQSNGDSDPFLTHAAVLYLRKDPETLAQARNHQVVAVRRAAMLADRFEKSTAISQFLSDPSEGIVIEAARAIYDAPVASELPKLAALLDGDCSQGTLRRALNANFRLGGAIAAERLAKLALSNRATEIRVEALECMAQWASPDAVDRVVGLWRPIPKRDAEDALAALRPHWTKLLSDKEEAVALAALACLRDLKEHNFPEALAVALASPSATMRMTALGLAASAEMEDRVIKLTEDESLRVAQAAFAALGRIKSPKLAGMALEIDRFRPEVRLDLLQAAGKRRDDGALLLIGGNATNGKRIFEERVDLTCTRCHALKGVGGTVGPALDGIGKRFDRQYLLESITHPNKAIAKGFETATISLNDGASVVGTVLKETADSIEVNSPEDGKVTVQKRDIKARQAALSAMPEGLATVMTPVELRDLVEYLASLR